MVNYVQPAGSAYEPWAVEQQLVNNIDSAENPSAMRMLMGYAAQRMGANIDQQRAQRHVLGLQQQQSAAEQRQNNVKSIVDMLKVVGDTPGAARAFQTSGMTGPLLSGVDLEPAVYDATVQAGGKIAANYGSARNAGIAVPAENLSRATGMPINYIPSAAEISARASGGDKGPTTTYSGNVPAANADEVADPVRWTSKVPTGTPYNIVRDRAIARAPVPSATNPGPARTPEQTATPQSAATPPPARTATPNGTNSQSDQGRAIKALSFMQGSTNPALREAAADIVANSPTGQPTVSRDTPDGSPVIVGAKRRYPLP